MELALFVYLAGFVGNLSVMFGFITIVVCGVTFGYTVWYLANKDTYGDRFQQKYRKSYIVLALCSGLITAILPSEKTMYMMAGAYATQSVVQSETMQKVVDLVNLKLDEELAKVKPKE